MMKRLPRRSLSPSLLAPALVAIGALACTLLTGCSSDGDGDPVREVVLYCAHDQVHAEPLVREFERKTGIKVRTEYDIEAHKTVGLVRRIREEQGRPRCDVFWNNEVAHTVSLASDGLLAAYDSPSAADIPAQFRDPERRWTGFGARARVFILNTDRLGDRAAPDGMWDLVDPAWKADCGMARPLTGTTLTHVAALYTVLGEEETREYLDGLRANEVHLTSGNATLMRQVRESNFTWGWTDTDDYWVAKSDPNGYAVDAVFPDGGPDGIGTLLIPNTVAILANAPHPDEARVLVDYLLTAEFEAKLADSRSAQIPVHESLKGRPHKLPLDGVKWMEVDYAEVGAVIDERFEELKEMFLD